MRFDSEIAEIASKVDFSQLNGKNILITGGSGFVGSWLLHGLSAASIYQHKKFKVCVLDRTAFEKWMIIDPDHFDYVFHLAPVFDRHIKDKLLETRPRRIVYASSGAVYLNPLNDYGHAKIDAENSLMASGADVRIARLFTFCGAYLRPGNFAVGNFVKNALAGEPLRVNGTGATVRSYMYGADLSVWLWKIMLDGETGSIYNVGSEQPITILELAERVCKVLDINAEIRVANDGFTEHAPYYVPDTSLTRAELDVKESYLLEQQISRYADWMIEGEDEDL
jgi:nucleoside-diphosphate-sugar epimerase